MRREELRTCTFTPAGGGGGSSFSASSFSLTSRLASPARSFGAVSRSGPLTHSIRRVRQRPQAVYESENEPTHTPGVLHDRQTLVDDAQHLGRILRSDDGDVADLSNVAKHQGYCLWSSLAPKSEPCPRWCTYVALQEHMSLSRHAC